MKKQIEAARDRVGIKQRRNQRVISEYYKIMNSATAFKSAKEFQEYLRAGGELEDYIVFNGSILTMDFYDVSGRTVTYGNVSEPIEVSVSNRDRYETMDDSIVEQSEQWWYRTDVTYFDQLI